MRAPELRLYPDELIVDLFAGGGGASVGIEWALGRSPDVAINHDKEAISMHRVNHPDTKHYIENVWRADPRKVCGARRVGLMWLSPDCKHFSKAKGGKPKSKKIRSLAWIAVYWVKALKTRKPRVIVLENVEEFQKWGPLLADGTPCPARIGTTFRRFVRQLETLGYVVEHRELVAADYGAPTSRRRLFLIARCDDNPIVWPQATHGPGRAEAWRTAAECIDWSHACPSIFERKKPLADNTQRRIARGIEKYVKKDPFIVPVMHAGDARVHGLDEPVRTITGAHRGEFALVNPYLVRTAHADVGKNGSRRWGHGEHSIDLPVPTIPCSNDFALVAPFLKPRYGEREGQDPRARSLERPMPTVVPTANGGDLVATFLAKHNAGHEATGQSLDRPMATVVGRGQKALVAAHITQYSGMKESASPRGGSLGEPLRTVTADPRHGLVAATITKHFGGESGRSHRPDKPLGTVMPNGVHHSLVASSIVKLRGTCQHGQPVTRPLGTISAQGNHFAEVRAFLMKYHRDGGQLAALRDPMPTVVATDSLALVTVEGEPHVIVDIGMRMLQPRELFSAHDFPKSYRIDRGADGEPMTKEAQVRMCGNSVPPPMAAAIVRAQFEHQVIEVAA